MGGSSVVSDRDPVKESGRPPRHQLEDLRIQRNLGIEPVLEMGLERPVLTGPCSDCFLQSSVAFRLLGRDFGTVGWLRDAATDLLAREARELHRS